MKAVEVVMIYEDANGHPHVYRWKGDAAEAFAACVEAGDYWPPNPTEIVHKPLRKVTEVEGVHRHGGGGQNLIIAFDGKEPMQFFWLDCLLPSGVRAEQRAGGVDTNEGPRCKFRITVEAEPVKENHE